MPKTKFQNFIFTVMMALELFVYDRLSKSWLFDL